MIATAPPNGWIRALVGHASPDRSRCGRSLGAALRAMDTDRLVDFLCVRETHWSEPSSPVVSLHSGALMLCPRGETLGHVWRAAAGAPFVDDRTLARAIAAGRSISKLPLRAN